MATSALKELHDSFLADRPEDAEHDELNCPFCATKETAAEIPDNEGAGGAMGDKTYSEDEVKAAVRVAVDEALAPSLARIEELETTAAASESEAALAEITAQHEAAQADLQAKVDEATLTAEQAKKSHDDLVAWLDGEKDAAEKAAQIEARREERLATAKAAAEFPEGFVKHLESIADRLAAMDDEEFTARVSEWAALVGGKPGDSGSKDDELPKETALLASREERGGGGKKSAIKELAELQRSGIDPRTL